MRRSIYLPLLLVFVATGIVAILIIHRGTAQEWNRWAPTQPPAPAMIENPTVSRVGQNRPEGARSDFVQHDVNAAGHGQPRSTKSAFAPQGGANVAAELFEPNRIAVPTAGRLPSSPDANQNDWAQAHTPRPEFDDAHLGENRQPMDRETFQTALPPLRMENPYYHEQPQPIRQVQAVADTPAAARLQVQAANNATIETDKTDKSDKAEQPAALAQPTAASPAAGNASSAAAEPASSRRPKPFAEPATRFAEREVRPNPPVAPPTVTPPIVAPTTVDPPTAATLEIPHPPTPAPTQAAAPETRPAATSVLFTAEAPVLAVRTAGPATIAVGKAATYAIEIANSGTADADDVSVLIDLPPWAEVSSTDATSGAAHFEPVAEATGRIKWTLYQLGGGKREQLTLKITPRQSRPIDLAVNWTYVPKPRSAQIEVQEPKLQLALAGPQDVHYGETKTYTITLSNPGTGAAENVTLELLPVTSGQDSGGTSQIGTIEAGGRRTIEIELTARQAGDLELRAQAFGDGGLQCEGAQAIHVRGALEITAAGPPIKYAGTTAVYQLRVLNAGDAGVNGVMAAAVLPRGAAFVSASEGGAVQQGQGRIHWQLGPMRPGAARVLELRCTLAEAGSNRLDFLATGSDDLSVAAQCVTRVEALADLKLQINDPPGPVAAGEAVIYEVTLMNRGTKAAERVQIHAMFSEGIEPLAVEGAAGTLHVGQVALQPIERIAAGQQVTVKISARAQAAGNHTFGVQVACADPQTQLAAQETTQFYDNGGTPAVGPTPASEPAPLEARLPPRLGSP